MEARLLRVTGAVQGVGLRIFCVAIAAELGIYGYAKNLPSGEVEIWIEGPAKNLEAFINRLRIGNGFSRIDHLVSSAETAKYYQRFSFY
ncbi:MAG: acylphosphatase [Culicoidibacterales bacterium]